MLTPYHFFRLYQSCNLHFTSSFDILKYGAKNKASTTEMWDKRRDKTKFEMYAAKCENERIAFHFCIANFVHNYGGWLYKETTEAQDIYNQWSAYHNSFKFNFEREYSSVKKVMDDKGFKYNDLLVPTASGNHPPLLQLLNHGKVTPEFVVTMHNYKPFLSEWYDKYGAVDPYLQKQIFTLQKYAPLSKLVVKEIRGQSEH